MGLDKLDTKDAEFKMQNLVQSSTVSVLETNFSKKHAEDLKDSNPQQTITMSSPSRDFDSINLAFPEQPKTKVIAEEILMQVALD